MARADSVLSTPPINTSVDPTRRFETLKDAEDTLTEQGFKLVPNTCNWIDDAGRIDAGVYPVEEAYGVSKYRIECRALDATPTRRRFLTVAAGASVASVGALTAAAMVPPIPAASAQWVFRKPIEDAAHASPALKAAAKALDESNDRLTAAKARFDEAEIKMEAWTNGNPEPTRPTSAGRRAGAKGTTPLSAIAGMRSWRQSGIFGPVKLRSRMSPHGTKMN